MENNGSGIKDIIVYDLIETLENNPEMWKKTWSNLAKIKIPHNPLTGTKYTGINLINLMIQSNKLVHDDNRWSSFIQAKQNNYYIKKGQKSLTNIIFYKLNTNFYIDDKKFNIKNQENTEIVNEVRNIVKKENINLSNSILWNNDISILIQEINNISNSKIKLIQQPYIYSIPVFNYSQMANVPEIEKEIGFSWEVHQKAESLISKSGINVLHDQIDSNFYLRNDNCIHLASKSSFHTKESYYSTILHELAHAKISDGTINFDWDINTYHTDIKSRAKEELRAELSSIFMCAEIGLNYDLNNHSSYINSWLKIFKNDKNELFRAINEARIIADACLNCDYKLDKIIITNSKFNDINNNDMSYSM